LGAHKHEVALGIVIPSAFSGIVASFILAISRAVGETMIVSIAAGSTPKLTLNPLESIQTMTAYISQISLGEAPFGSLEYKTIFSVGLTLFLMTLVVNLIGQWIAKRYWRRY
ncbi:ABC transporter permease subunit, partial [Candidatus Bathyarchaeota archaeon]|nr:ABC transporter permease subunit [Candidatus Bathyarchaeota archaeon]